MLRNNILLVSFVSLLLVGCATPPAGIQVQIQRVEIPVAVPCSVKIPTPPVYNFGSLKTTDDIFTKDKTLLADRDLSLGYEDELLAALNSCVK